MSDNDDYWGDIRKMEDEEDAEEAQRRKEEVGMAEPGTEEYDNNARYILDAYRHPNSETREKRGQLGMD